MKCPDGFLFDECDRALVESRSWHRHDTEYTAYVRSSHPLEYFHRAIMDAPAGLLVDHINGNGLDNRRCNLRVVSPAQNLMNKKGQRDGRKGIHYEAFTQRWRAEIIAYGKRYRSKRLQTEEEAIAWREEAERTHHGQYAGFGTGGTR